MISRFVWLPDTNVVSEMMQPSPEPRIAAYLDSIADEGVGLAAVTMWEILDGFGRPNPDRHRDDLIEQFQDLLDELFEDRIVDWTVADALACARIMEDKHRQGEPLDDHLPDAILASTAACPGLTIDTWNTGVEFVDPWIGGVP